MNTRKEAGLTVTQMGMRGENKKRSVQRGRPKGIPQGPRNGYGGFDPNNVYRPEMFVVKDKNDAKFFNRVQKHMVNSYGWKRVDVEQLRERKGGKKVEH